MNVAVIGAGVSGLAAGRALRAVGLEVTIYEASADIGGVWSAARNYPGLSLQSDKRSYSFSDAPMPDGYPKYPNGRQVRTYLQQFAEREGLLPHIRLGTRVVEAELTDSGTWRLELETPEGPRSALSTWVVVANGLNSWSHVPDLPGRSAFESAGGSVLTPSELGDGSMFAGRRVAVLGYGKSAADAVVAAAQTAVSTDMIVRAVAWKLPKRIGRLTFQHLLLTRGGEFLLWAPYRTFPGHLARVGTAPFRKLFARWLEVRIRSACELERRGISPAAPITTLTHLTTDGFFDTIDRGDVTLHTGVSVVRLSDSEGRPTLHLTDGSGVHADLLVAATGYDQDVRFFGPRARAALMDGAEELVLQRHMLPRALDRLAFVGWAQSFRSPLGAEIQSLWLAAYISGLTPRLRRRQPITSRHRLTRYRLTHDAAARSGLPLVATGSGFLDLDEWIEEAGFTLPLRVRILEWFRPLDPAHYRGFLPELAKRAHALSRTRGLGAVQPPEADLEIAHEEAAR